MKRPERDQYEDIARVAKANPRFVEWLQHWCDDEMALLPYVVDKDELARAQGRCQVLRSIVKVLHEAPEKAA